MHHRIPLFLLLASLLALTAPAGAQTPPPTPAPSPSPPPRVWSPRLPAGAYHVRVTDIQAIALQDYDTFRDGQIRRTVEMTVETRGGTLARFYWAAKATDAVALPAELEQKKREVEQAVRDLTGIDSRPDADRRVRKDYPFTTHSRIVEFLLPTEADVRSLYDEALAAWFQAMRSGN